MGLVEISGMACGPQTIPAGITGDACYYYRAIAWQLKQNGKNQEWKRVADESLYVPFFVEDPTGRMLIDPAGADLDVHRNFKDEIGTAFFSTRELMPTNVARFLLRYGLSGAEGIRLEEYCIKPDYPLFVLGTLGQSSNQQRRSWTPEPHISASSSLPSSGLLQALSRIPGITIESSTTQIPLAAASAKATNSLPTGQARAAGNPPAVWSTVSLDEEKVSAAAVLLAHRREPSIATADPPDMPASQEISPGGFDMNPAVAIGKGAKDAPFTISSRSEREVVQSLAWKSALYIWGGPALTLGCLYFLSLAMGWM
jgi:hypothetical protein